jgi:HCOMODA/2-hydroxy-3-carboxy-muconic semialdehyde decarboxylase
MMTPATLSRRSVLTALGLVFLWGCASQPPAADTPPAAAHPEQSLIDDLVLANRMLSRELNILDAQGHVTARSRINPNHYYISRYLAPGDVTASDLIENDLDSNAVAGPRNDQARETYLHGEIYKARPDVMAIVHAHTPEFVAFGMSSVPLWNGDSPLPVWDIRQFNKGRSGIVSRPELGRAMAATLGRHEAVLLWGHGIAMTSGSLPELVSRVNALRSTARLQQAVVAMGGAWTPQPARVPQQPDSTAASLGEAEGRGASGDGTSNQEWEYLKRAVLKDTGGTVPASPPPAPEKRGDPDEAAARDLALANRILVSADLGILDAFGHVSVRNVRNPTRYFIAPRVAPAAVTPGDIVQRDITAADPDTHGLSIHDEVYKARPDVMAVLYARTPEIVAFTAGAARLRPIVNGGGFLRDGLPLFDTSTLDPRTPMLANPALGRGVAEALGKKAGVLLARHGFVLTSSSLYELVNRAYQLRQNARIQQQAIALRGKVAYLDDKPAPAEPATDQAQAAPLGPPEGRAWVYWSQNVTLE